MTAQQLTEQDFLHHLNARLPANEIEIPKIDCFHCQTLDPTTNWLAKNYEALPAFEREKFFIYGTGLKGDIPADKTPLLIEAETAFGSGQHATTTGCLKALTHLKEVGFTPKNILDLGTGSGILSIAAHKLWQDAQILATDIESESIISTNQHITLNNAHNIKTIQSNGFKHIDPDYSFDLIIANILIDPLRLLSKEIIARTNNDGKIILSGFLIEQENDLNSYYNPLSLEESYHCEEWSTLLFSKS